MYVYEIPIPVPNSVSLSIIYSALEMTCRAPKEGICGGGSTLSEYELYFNFARHDYPQSVKLRDPALMWANGPAPGLQFWPNAEDKLTSDGYKSSWVGHRQNEGLRLYLFVCNPLGILV